MATCCLAGEPAVCPAVGYEEWEEKKSECPCYEGGEGRGKGQKLGTMFSCHQLCCYMIVLELANIWQQAVVISGTLAPGVVWMSSWLIAPILFLESGQIMFNMKMKQYIYPNVALFCSYAAVLAVRNSCDLGGNVLLH